MSKQPKRVAILGFDCAEPHLIQRHIDEGHLPNFKKVFGGGVLAENCLSPFPTITPPNWASIATGAWPGTHQVTDFHLHKKGTSPTNVNTFEAFNSAHCKAEYIWDRLDAAGKKCIVVNYPGAWPSKMKNGIVMAGAGLSFDELRDGHVGLESGLTTGYDQLVTTGFFPWGTKVKFADAGGWKNLPAKCEDPMEAKFPVAFRQSLHQYQPIEWYLLATQSKGDGYDRITLSPTRDYKDAFCTLALNEWSKKTYVTLKRTDGKEDKAFFRVKLLELSDDAEDFRFLITRPCVTEGWSSPPEVAGEIKSDEGIFSFAGGLLGYSIGWYELDTYAETTEFHDLWLGDVVTTLLKNKPWDLFAMHSHPFDWSYHSILTEMDENTCSSKEAYKAAWDFHLRIHKTQDKLLGRIMEAAGEDTLFVLVSDHGAVADGTSFNPYIPLMQKGLCHMVGSAEHADLDMIEGGDDAREMVKSMQAAGPRLGKEVIEMMTLNLFKPDLTKSKAIPQRTIYVYINLKGRDPEGIVDPKDYEKVQQEIIDALYTYVDASTGKRPVSLALSKQDARILGLHGDLVGDVVYAIYPEYGGQHGPQLATSEWGVGKLKALEAYYGPGIKKGYRLERTCGLTDVVPTVCYLMGWPVPAQVEGNVLYQALENPDIASEEIQRLKDALLKMEASLTQGQKQH